MPTKIPELWNLIYFAAPILLLRVFVEAVVGLQLGKWLGYINEPLSVAMRNHICGGFAQQTKQKKVLESFWRFVSYTMLFATGCYVLKDKSWLFKTHDCFIGYPRHPIDTDIWYYYMIQGGFYICLLLCSVFDARRSDFWEMTVHHIVTIGLISFSWTVNFVRMGTLILISHDVSDIFLELAKLIRYARRYTGLANAAFVVFLISWILTRLIYFPIILVWTGIRDGPGLIQPDYEVGSVFNTLNCLIQVFNFKQVPYAPRVLLLLLICLLVLHIFWTVLILKIVLRTLRDGAAADIRSDSEETEDESSEMKEKKKLLRKRKELDRQKKPHED